MVPAQIYLNHYNILFTISSLPLTTPKGAAYVAKAVDSRNIRRGSMGDVDDTNGYQIDFILPCSWQPEGFRSFSPAYFLKAGSAFVVNLTDRDGTVFPQI